MTQEDLAHLRQLRRKWRLEATRLRKNSVDHPRADHRDRYESDIYEACANEIDRLITRLEGQ